MPVITLKKPAVAMLEKQATEISLTKIEMEPYQARLQMQQAEHNRFVMYLIEEAGFSPADYDLSVIEYRTTSEGTQITLKPKPADAPQPVEVPLPTETNSRKRTSTKGVQK